MGSPAKKAPSGPYADKLWREALRRQVLKRVEKQQNLDRLATVVFAKAMDGDMVAAKEIGDRLDGKVPQALIGGSESDPPVRTRIEVVIVDPQTAGR